MLSNVGFMVSGGAGMLSNVIQMLINAISPIYIQKYGVSTSIEITPDHTGDYM